MSYTLIYGRTTNCDIRHYRYANRWWRFFPVRIIKIWKYILGGSWKPYRRVRIYISQRRLCPELHGCMYLCIYPLRHTAWPTALLRASRGLVFPRASHLLLCRDRKWRQRAQSAALKTLYPLVIYSRPPSQAHNATPSFLRKAICEFQLWGAGCFITKSQLHLTTLARLVILHFNGYFHLFGRNAVLVKYHASPQSR